jgi:hypothetical protein
MCSTSIAPESRIPPALLIHGGSELLSTICVGFIGPGPSWSKTLEENMGRGDRRGNREAKKPKKLKPKEIAPISTLASIQKMALTAANPKKK